MSKSIDKKLVAQLRRTYAIIRRGWTQGPVAVNADGERVDLYSPNAVKCCLAGALTLATSDFDNEIDLEKYIGKRLPRRYSSDVIRFNETEGRKKSEVLALLRRCINDALEGKP